METSLECPVNGGVSCPNTDYENPKKPMESSLAWLRTLGVNLKKIYDAIMNKVYGLPSIKDQLDVIEEKIDKQPPYVEGVLYVDNDVVATETGHRLSEKLTAEQTQIMINESIKFTGSLTMEAVRQLPSNGVNYRLYFLYNPETEKFDEYMWINAEWQKIGTTDLNMDGYFEQIVTMADFYNDHFANAAAIDSIRQCLDNHLRNGRIHTSVEQTVSEDEAMTFNWNASSLL